MLNNLRVRWMIRRDMPEVLEIEQLQFEFPWSEENFISCLRQRNCIGLVADTTDNQSEAIGFVVYELQKTRIHILNIAVHPSCCGKGVGKAMVNRLIEKLRENNRTRLLLEVRETNVAAQRFFRRMGFRAVSILRDYYQDTDEDAYLFQYRFSGDGSTATNKEDEECSC